MNGDCSRVGRGGRRGNEGKKRRVDGGGGECVRLMLGAGYSLSCSLSTWLMYFSSAWRSWTRPTLWCISPSRA